MISQERNETIAQYSKLVITKAGQDLIAKMLSDSATVTFTKVCSSDSQYEVDNLEALTDIGEVKQEVEVSKVTRTNDASVKIEAAFSNTELTAGYYMRTLGLYAKGPDGIEVLYAACIELTNNCYMPPYNNVTVSAAYIQLYTAVGSTDSVNLEVNSGAYATIGELEELKKEFESLTIELDTELNETSENAVQNKVVTAAIKSLGVPVLIQTDEPEDKTALWVQLPSSEEDVS
jgi:hypothetical protein